MLTPASDSSYRGGSLTRAGGDGLREGMEGARRSFWRALSVFLLLPLRLSYDLRLPR